MKNRNKIFLILMITTIIVCTCIFTFRKKNKDANTNNNFFNYDLITLDWNEIVNIDIDGAEGHSNVVLTYNEIPELDNRVSEIINNWESKRTEIDLNEEDAQKEYELVSKLTAYKGIQWCTLSDNWNTLSNGDELVITCGNEILKELGYEYDDLLTITVNNLIKTVAAEPLKDNTSSDIRDSDNYQEKEDLIKSETTNNSSVKTENIGNDTYVSIGNDVYVYPEDLNNLEIENEEGKRYFVYVETQTDFQKVKAYASENNNIDYIQIGNQIFSKENNFEEGEEWRGVSIDD